METNFKQQVFNLTKKIPKGKVSTYKEIAYGLNTRAFRAVGTALSKNIDNKIPCHRIVNSNGYIGKFSKNGDIKTKKFLLEKEGIEINDNLKIKDFNKVIFSFN